MKKFFNEFKTFITRGNVLDMAVGVIVGGAFTAIVNALGNTLMLDKPPGGLFTRDVGISRQSRLKICRTVSLRTGASPVLATSFNGIMME